MFVSHPLPANGLPPCSAETDGSAAASASGNIGYGDLPVAAFAGRRLHVRSSGRGGPMVVLESGIAASSLSWTLVQPQVAEFTRVCSYDRAGLGWSDAAGPTVTAAGNADALATMLRALAIPPPY